MNSISPLAKILAEANGIDWHSIRGSGEGGMVSEQDILNYLTRVMSGEEDPPAAPVDEVPHGWTGEMPPMPSLNPDSIQALHAAGVETDLTAYMGQAGAGSPETGTPVTRTDRDPAQPVPTSAQTAPQPSGDGRPPTYGYAVQHGEVPSAPAAMAPAATPLYSAPAPAPVAAPHPVGADEAADVAAAEVDFELDDEQLDDGQLDHGEEASVQTLVVTPAPRPAGESASPEHAGAAEVAPAAPEPLVSRAEAEPHPQAIRPDAGPDAERAVPAASGGFGLGGFLSRLYRREPEPQPELAAPFSPPAPPVLPARQAGEAAPLLGEPLALPTPPVPDTPVAAPLVADQWRDQPAPRPEDEVQDEQRGELEERQRRAPRADDGDGRPLAPGAALPDDGDMDRMSGEAVHTVQDGHGVQAAREAHEPPEPHEQAGPGGGPERAREQPADPTPDLTTQLPAIQMPAGQPGPVPVEETAAPVPAARTVTLRRVADASALLAAQSQLSEALSQDVPLTLLVARAAARSLGVLGSAAGGQVALADDAGRPLDGDVSGDFRALVGRARRPAPQEDVPGLLVLDAGQHDLDEFHPELPAGSLSLSVGRPQLGAQTGLLPGQQGGQLALSLRGQVGPAQGAQFLQDVAGLLQMPIKLLF